MDTLIQFMDGYLVYYNFFKPNEALNGKTPAEAAKVDYKIKNWKELSQVPVSKQAEIQNHKHITRITPKTPRITPRSPFPLNKRSPFPLQKKFRGRLPRA
jgi:hypothetical protein